MDTHIIELTRSQRVESTLSSGDNGGHFQLRVQAFFLSQMLLGGLIPSMPGFFLTKLCFQGKGKFETDDIIGYLRDKMNNEAKVLCQVKSGMNTGISSIDFKETIKDAWIDFHSKRFNKRTDHFLYITQFFNQSDNNVIQIFDDLQRSQSNSEGFWYKYYHTNSYSKKANKKFNKIIQYITFANDGQKPPDQQIFDFLFTFRIISCDLNENFISSGGINIALIFSQYAHGADGYRFTNQPRDIWSGLVNFCMDHNNGIEFGPEVFNEDELKELVDKQPIINEAKLSDKNNTHFDISMIMDDASIRDNFIKLCLIGAWNESFKGDRETLCNLLNLNNYDEIVFLIGRIEDKLPGLIQHYNGQIKISDRHNIIKSIAKYVTSDTLNKILPTIEKTISDEDQYLNQTLEQQILINIRGELKPGHSLLIRQEMASTLAIISNNSDFFTNARNADLKVQESQKNILNKDMDLKLLPSIAPLLPILAEINPGTYISLFTDILNAIQENDSPGSLNLSPIFDSITSSLLILAWDKNIFSRACLLLVKTVEIFNSNDNYNQVIELITSILLPWHPQTLAPVDERIELMRVILNKNPKIGWKILTGLLPKATGTTFGLHRPKWLNMSSEILEENKVTNEDYKKQSEAYIDLAFSEIKNHVYDGLFRLTDMISYICHTTNNEYMPRLLECLSLLKIQDLSKKSKKEIRDVLCDLLSDFKRKAIKLPDDQTLKINTIIEDTLPDHSLRKAVTLFDKEDWEFEPDHVCPYEERCNKIQQMRDDAIKELLESQSGYDLVELLAEEIEPKHIQNIGFALASIDDNKCVNRIFPEKLDDREPLCDLAKGYAHRKYFKYSLSWLDNMDVKNWTTKQKITLLTSFPLCKTVWSYAELILEDNIEYWKALKFPQRLSYLSMTNNNSTEDWKYIIKMITLANNPLSVYFISICLDLKMKPDELICINALNIKGDVAYAKQLRNDDILKIISYLQKSSKTPKDELLKIEWSYLPLFDPYYCDNKPTTIINSIKSDTDLVVEYIISYYKPDKDTSKHVSKFNSQQVEQLYLIFYQYEVIPGFYDNKLNQKEFDNFVKIVLKKAEKSGCKTGAMRLIGEILSKSPISDNEFFIDKHFIELLNTKEYEPMRESYEIGIYNLEPIRTIDPNGEPEFEKSRLWKKRADTLNNLGYEHFARTLFSISDRHRRQGEADIKRCKEKYIDI